MARAREGAAAGRVVPNDNGGQRRRGGERRGETTEGEEERGRWPPPCTDDNKGNTTVKDCTNTNEGGGIAANVIDDGRRCRFLRGVMKAMSNRQGNANDNLRDDAATDILPDNLSCRK